MQKTIDLFIPWIWLFINIAINILLIIGFIDNNKSLILIGIVWDVIFTVSVAILIL